MRPGGDCFSLGPVLIARSNLDAASAMHDDATAQWVVNVHFADDEFLDKVAEPMIGRRIAIVVDGDVQSVPEVNPGITGRDVQISGGFTEAEARALATRLVAGVATGAPS
jgi:preprotein translocase subunit SecD